MEFSSVLLRFTTSVPYTRKGLQCALTRCSPANKPRQHPYRPHMGRSLGPMWANGMGPITNLATGVQPDPSGQPTDFRTGPILVRSGKNRRQIYIGYVRVRYRQSPQFALGPVWAPLCFAQSGQVDRLPTSVPFGTYLGPR
jgi:hypothetical protein